MKRVHESQRLRQHGQEIREQVALREEGGESWKSYTYFGSWTEERTGVCGLIKFKDVPLAQYGNRIPPVGVHPL